MQDTPTTKYVLVDYENVHPEDFSALTGNSVEVKIFVGPNQATIPTRMMSALGSAAEYFVLKRQGRNALDFLIAYKLGQLSASNPSASFEILSNDTGFDPLIEYLRENGVPVRRINLMARTTIIENAIANLKKRNGNLPKSADKLHNALKSSFKHLSKAQVMDLLDGLQRLDVIAIADDAVTYNFPAEAKRSA